MAQSATIKTRTEKIIAYLQECKPLIDSVNKGSIEINFSGDKLIPSLKIFHDIK